MSCAAIMPSISSCGSSRGVGNPPLGVKCRRCMSLPGYSRSMSHAGYSGASSHLSMEAGAVANPTRFWPCALDRQSPGAFGFETVRFKEPRGPTGISQPVEKLLDVDGTDAD